MSRETMTSCPQNLISKVWWWLPPVLWPDNETDMFQALRKVQEEGARNFMLNAPWQAALFADKKKAVIWAGPFCNVTNTSAILGLKKMGFSGAVISPELGKVDYMPLPGQSPIPLGIVLSGNWPLCISRVLAEEVQEGAPFTSPKSERAWAAKYGDEFWIFPNWRMDIREKKRSLATAGYRCFVHLSEPIPKSIRMKKRPGLWNWKLGLK
jgi:putative protease